MVDLEWKFSQVFGDKSPVDEVTDGGRRACAFRFQS
jgi:hypothetical protein